MEKQRNSGPRSSYRRPYHRNSQGLSEAQIKNERRKHSLNVMRNTTQSAQIKNVLENVMTCVLIEGTPEERLQSIMTKAIESGVSLEHIFRFFNGGNTKTKHITKKSFVESLERLG